MLREQQIRPSEAQFWVPDAVVAHWSEKDSAGRVTVVVAVVVTVVVVVATSLNASDSPSSSTATEVEPSVCASTHACSSAETSPPWTATEMVIDPHTITGWTLMKKMAAAFRPRALAMAS